MQSWVNYGSVCALALLTTVNYAAPPRNIVTNNYTNVESNAYIAGVIPSQHPTPANTEDASVPWAAVKMACFGHTKDNKCWAIIKMATDTSSPVELGRVEIDLTTGVITPAVIIHNGYKFTYKGIIGGNDVVVLTIAKKVDE